MKSIKKILNKIVVSLIIVFIIMHNITNFIYANNTTTNINFVDIAGGGTHTLAIDDKGYIWAWGANNDYKLGLGENWDYKTKPMKIVTSTTFKKVATGSNFSLALDKDGNIWSWGSNAKGQLGIGSTSSNCQTTPIKINSSVQFVDIDAESESCLALDKDGNIWSWGDNYFGQLGIGSTNNYKNIPTKITSSTTFSKISISGGHSIALDKDGNIWSWGSNSKGELGDNTLGGESSQPVLLNVNTKFNDISSTGNYCVAINEEGHLWFWGINIPFSDRAYESNSLVPIPYDDSLPKFTQIKTGGTEVALALDEEGNVWGIGNNSKGELGISYDNFSLTNWTKTIETPKFSKIFAGTTSMGLDKDGNLWAWGDNYYGQFGNDTRTIKTETPIQITTSIKSYKVTFKNYDGTVLQEKDVNYGQTATYTGIVPTKNIDGYTVTLSGWSPNLNNTIITEDTIFTAQYEAKINNYNIIYNDTEGAQFEQENPKTYTIETDSFTLSNPSKAGYTFERLGRNWNNKRYKNSNNK